VLTLIVERDLFVVTLSVLLLVRMLNVEVPVLPVSLSTILVVLDVVEMIVVKNQISVAMMRVLHPVLVLMVVAQTVKEVAVQKGLFAVEPMVVVQNQDVVMENVVQEINQFVVMVVVKRLEMVKDVAVTQPVQSEKLVVVTSVVQTPQD
tara:strand:- start:249 stop:695 length:447 start_codon:yes stop_codon:yes gene_type:complete